MPKALIIGLGNPGPRYKGTRHNVGFAVADALAARYGVGFRAAGRLRAGSARVGETQLFLVKPMTFMNLSGEGLQPFISWHRVSADRILVVHDDLDLEEGRLRFKRSGGAGGHRGVESLIRSTGTSEFPRLKIGIGRPPEGIDPVNFVLMRPGEKGAGALGCAVERAAEACLVWLRDGLDAAMGQFNQAPTDPAETAGDQP
jgi:PTH1 family peptidyl-tRNA hydrolase